MKATGIVRRIDDLGRVVIPKEIRRTLRIREGDPLEIFTSNDGEVIFKKYSPIGELSAFAGQYAEILHKTSSRPVIVCDRDHVVSASGLPKKELLERRISPALEELIEERKSYIYGQQGGALLYPVEGIERPALVEYPIISAGMCAVRFSFWPTASPPSPPRPRRSCCRPLRDFWASRWRNSSLLFYNTRLRCSAWYLLFTHPFALLTVVNCRRC